MRQNTPAGTSDLRGQRMLAAPPFAAQEPLMSNTYTAIFERDDDWIIAYCPEIPGANGQGRTKSEARESLAAAIALILQDRREDVLRGLPDDAEQETVTVA
jgi:predicted RNase H-like HicB family nuclease